jgi:IrrE N-terminal-like domain
MTSTGVAVDRAAVYNAVGSLYRDTGLEASYAAAGIAPLRQLVAAHPLAWYEVPGLTQQNSATTLHDKMRRPVDAPPGCDGPLAGRLYATERGGIILVRQDDPLVRRRFTVAHELGHYILHHLPRLANGRAVFDEELPLPPQVKRDDMPAPGQSRARFVDGGHITTDPVLMEAEADLFAADLLMPEPLCRALVTTHRRLCGEKRQVLGRRLASECLVSQTAMLRRLRELNLPEALS